MFHLHNFSSEKHKKEIKEKDEKFSKTQNELQSKIENLEKSAV
jgi:hypothetical protein